MTYSDLYFTFAGTTATSFDFDNWQFFEQPTSVAPIQKSSVKTQHRTYDLQGRKASNSTNHSIKIIDGKKIIQ